MDRISVLVEVNAAPDGGHALVPDLPADLPCAIDRAFGCVPVPRHVRDGHPLAPADESTAAAVLRADIEPAAVAALRAAPGVIAVYSDAPIGPFDGWDCEQQTARGSAEDVAAALGAPLVWALELDGAGVVIGVVDGGVDKSKYPAVIGGWSPVAGATWGVDPAWARHGDMCAFDCLIAAPNAKLYDLAIGRTPGPVGALLSSALQAFDWALERFRRDGTPQILSNSWGLRCQADDAFPPGDPANYSHNPNHLLMRKAMQLADEGILMVFAAGNCGEHCAGCGAGDTGPGRSIRGLNGHPRIISVGAVNPLGVPIGYTSQGPATLAAEKPDVCGYSHFRGDRPCDNGTSAACPTVAGALALLRQRDPSLTQDRARELLIRTARPIHGLQHHPSTGFGVVDVARAFKSLKA